MDDIYYLSRLVLVKKIANPCIHCELFKNISVFQFILFGGAKPVANIFLFYDGLLYCHYTRPRDDSAESVCVPQTTAAVTQPRQFISPAAGGAKIQFRRKLCILNFH